MLDGTKVLVPRNTEILVCHIGSYVCFFVEEKKEFEKQQLSDSTRIFILRSILENCLISKKVYGKSLQIITSA